jgi:hypothetical protein
MSDPIDKHLGEALKRPEAPRRLVTGVMAKVENASRPAKTLWYCLLAAAVALVFVFTGVDHNKREAEKQVSAQQSQRQVLYALALTVDKLNRINGHLQGSAADVRLAKRQMKEGVK